MQKIHTDSGANKLLDSLLVDNALKNDAALARALEVAPPVISKLRHGRLAIGSTLILAIHETFGVPVAEIRRAVTA